MVNATSSKHIGETGWNSNWNASANCSLSSRILSLTCRCCLWQKIHYFSAHIELVLNLGCLWELQFHFVFSSIQFISLSIDPLQGVNHMDFACVIYSSTLFVLREGVTMLLYFLMCTVDRQVWVQELKSGLAGPKHVRS
jgi:hypothetical protein